MLRATPVDMLFTHCAQEDAYVFCLQLLNILHTFPHFLHMLFSEYKQSSTPFPHFHRLYYDYDYLFII